jgi:hypothetical protein
MSRNRNLASIASLGIALLITSFIWNALDSGGDGDGPNIGAALVGFPGFLLLLGAGIYVVQETWSGRRRRRRK